MDIRSAACRPRHADSETLAQSALVTLFRPSEGPTQGFSSLGRVVVTGSDNGTTLVTALIQRAASAYG